MNKKLQEKLFKKYPEIFANTDKPFSQSLMGFGICCEDGWYWLIEQLCSVLQKGTDKYEDPQAVAFQVKQKWGGLRFYVDGANDKQRAMISLVENMSLSICEDCGTMKNVKLVGKSWLRTLCEDCEEKNKNESPQ